MSSPPTTQPQGLRYYVLRGNFMVPMVPVDQLPFELKGVPRQLDHRQLSDEGWKFLCETDEVCSVLSPSRPVSTVPSRATSISYPRFVAPDHNVRVELSMARDGIPRHNRITPQPSAIEPASRNLPSTALTLADDASSMSERFASIYQKDAQRFGYQVPSPSGIAPDQSKKEYCTHWIKTGECAFISIGCKFKHEMPAVDKLRELGFTRGMPKWYAEKSALIPRGPTWMQRRLAHGNGDWEDLDEILAPRAFPDPATLMSRRVEERLVVAGGAQPQRSIAKKVRSMPPAPPSTPTLESVRPVSQISNLLIDLDDYPQAHYSTPDRT